MFTLQLIRFSLSFSLFCTIIPINFGHPYKFLRSKSQPIHMHCRGSNAVLFLFLHIVSKWRVTAWEMCLFLSCLSFRLTLVYVRKMLPPTSSDRARLHSLCSFASTEATHTCSRGTVANSPDRWSRRVIFIMREEETPFSPTVITQADVTELYTTTFMLIILNKQMYLNYPRYFYVDFNGQTVPAREAEIIKWR